MMTLTRKMMFLSSCLLVTAMSLPLYSCGKTDEGEPALRNAGVQRSLSALVSPDTDRYIVKFRRPVEGKAALRGYWGAALPNHPDLHFDLKGIYVGPDSVVIQYRNERGAEVSEYLRVDGDGKIVEGAAHHA